jgi:hypothetical protein
MAVQAIKRRFNADEYHRMGEAGVLGPEDRVELIEGEILMMSPIGNRHLASTDRSNRVMVRLAGDDAIVRVQGSIRLSFYTEPQPDLVLLRPRDDFYASRSAGPGDVLLILEIADSSLDYDRVVKARIYAEAGVADYWLVDLPNARLHVLRDPMEGAYRSIRTLSPGESVAPLAFPGAGVEVAALIA